jgi:hypothetical protein
LVAGGTDDDLYIRRFPKVAGPYPSHPRRRSRRTSPSSAAVASCAHPPRAGATPMSESATASSVFLQVSSALHVSGSPGEKLEQGPAWPAMLQCPVLHVLPASRRNSWNCHLPANDTQHRAVRFKFRSGVGNTLSFRPKFKLESEVTPAVPGAIDHLRLNSLKPEGIDIESPVITWHWQSRPALGILWPIDPCRHPFSSARRHLRGPHRAGFPQQGNVW